MRREGVALAIAGAITTLEIVMRRTHPILLDTVVTMRGDVRVPARRRADLDAAHWIFGASTPGDPTVRPTVRMAPLAR